MCQPCREASAGKNRIHFSEGCCKAPEGEASEKPARKNGTMIIENRIKNGKSRNEQI